MNNGMAVQAVIIIVCGLFGLYRFGRTFSLQYAVLSLLIGYFIAAVIVYPVSYSKKLREWWYYVWDIDRS